MKVSILLVMLFAVFAVDAQTDGKLRSELLAMRDRDQAAREGCDKGRRMIG